MEATEQQDPHHPHAPGAARAPDDPDGPAVGIDLGGTNILVGVVDHAGDILARHKARTPSDEGRDAVFDQLVASVKACCDEAGVKLKDVSTVGLGVPGPVDPKRGVVLEAVNLRWSETPVADIMTERLGHPVFLDNDVNVAVYGESRLGAGRGAGDMLGVWVGTGIGGGLILENKLFYGHHHTAGEIGHIMIRPGNPPGQRSLEHNCSRTAIVNQITSLIRSNRKSVIPDLVDGRLGKIKSKTLAEAYRLGDALTVEVIDDAADRLGVLLGNIVTLLSLDRIIVGGGLTEAMGELYVRRIRDAVHRVAFPEAARQVGVVASELGDDAGVVGAALIALDRLGV